MHQTTRMFSPFSRTTALLPVLRTPLQLQYIYCTSACISCIYLRVRCLLFLLWTCNYYIASNGTVISTCGAGGGTIPRAFRFYLGSPKSRCTGVYLGILKDDVCLHNVIIRIRKCTRIYLAGDSHKYRQAHTYHVLLQTPPWPKRVNTGTLTYSYRYDTRVHCRLESDLTNRWRTGLR